MPFFWNAQSGDRTTVINETQFGVFDVVICFWPPMDARKASGWLTAVKARTKPSFEALWLGFESRIRCLTAETATTCLYAHDQIICEPQSMMLIGCFIYAVVISSINYRYLSTLRKTFSIIESSKFLRYLSPIWKIFNGMKVCFYHYKNKFYIGSLYYKLGWEHLKALEYFIKIILIYQRSEYNFLLFENFKVAEWHGGVCRQYESL